MAVAARMKAPRIALGENPGRGHRIESAVFPELRGIIVKKSLVCYQRDLCGLSSVSKPRAGRIRTFPAPAQARLWNAQAQASPNGRARTRLSEARLDRAGRDKRFIQRIEYQSWPLPPATRQSTMAANAILF
jgi:hypothetical protein